MLDLQSWVCLHMLAPLLDSWLSLTRQYSLSQGDNVDQFSLTKSSNSDQFSNLDLRFILMESMMIFLGLASLLCVLKFRKISHKPFTPAWFTWLRYDKDKLHDDHGGHDLIMMIITIKSSPTSLIYSAASLAFLPPRLFVSNTSASTPDSSSPSC